MQNWIDITMAIKPDMMVYKNRDEKRPVIEVRANHQNNGFHESSIKMDLHTGTHIDMPLHMIENGKDSSEFDVSKVNGKSFVVDLSQSEVSAIAEEDLVVFDTELDQVEIVLLKTKNSLSDDFVDAFDYLSVSGAKYLVRKNIKAVGIDALGIERGSKNHETHKVLMHEDIYIIEGLKLDSVSQGLYTLHCLPMRILSVEGLPARAFLEKL